MRSVIRLPNVHPEPLPPELAKDEVRFPPELVRVFLKEHTQPGDVVFDPFAGYGTTLRTAEQLGRVAHGIELDDGRLAYARERLLMPERLVHGDARLLLSYGLPTCDFCMTGIPFCTEDETTDPLTWYAAPGRGYAAYLDDLRGIFQQVADLLRPDGAVVIEVANLRGPGCAPVTTLAWDVAQSVGQVLRFEGEVIVDWEPTYGHGYDHSYCLVFRNGRA
jgi:SAM-dependent methyltransferase